MTLCVAWTRETEAGLQLVMATDSLITGGFAYPHGTKLTVFDRGDCALCWEGCTSFTYSFTENARVDVEFSDSLGTKRAALTAVRDRITKVFNQLWAANLADRDSQFKQEPLSFFFGGYCPRYREVQLWHIRQDDKYKTFTASRRTPTLTNPCFIGSGAEKAKAIFHGEEGLTPYQTLLKVIEDPEVNDVGGFPQLVTIDRNGVEVIGFVKDGERYLFGRKLASSGHKTKVRYISYEDSEF